MEIGNTVEILKGSFTGKRGTVKAIAKFVPKSIGIAFDDSKITACLTWFEPGEVRELKY
jgi:hypothetical protein